MTSPGVPRPLRALAVIAAIAVSVLIALLADRPPAPVPASAPPEVFSSERAMRHLAVIAARPHRIGSAAHEEVRRYLLRELEALGLAPSVQEAVVAGRWGGRVATVRNVVARRRGSAAGKALLLMAHYDSVAMAPGAGDDGAGVAALLETARALNAGSTLKHDVIFLFTDGEEEGLLGAKAFADEHPWAGDVGLVLNFEGRGDRGPVLMFQTSDDNGALIRELARAAPHPRASSLAQAVYKRMPNDTDFSVWIPRGTAGLNFANIEGLARYHAPTDTIDNLDRGTLQHHGSYALSLARAFASSDLPPPAEPNATYFNVGPVFVRYPGALALPLALGGAALVAVFIALGRRRRALGLGGVALGAAAALGQAVIAAALCGAAWALATALHPDYALGAAARPALHDRHLASFFAIAVAVALGLQTALFRRLRAAELFAGAGVVWAALAILVAMGLPGGAYLLTWPLLAATALAIGLLLTDGFDGDRPLGMALLALSPAPAVLLWWPVLLQLATAFGPPAGVAIGLFAALILALAAPALRVLIEPARRAAALAAVGVAIALAALANATAPFDASYPRPSTLLVAVDGDARKAYWVSSDASLDAWTSKVLAGAARGPFPLDFPLRFAGPHFVREAPPATEPGPEIRWLDDASLGDRRALRLRVIPPPGAEVIGIAADGIASATVQGRSVSTAHGRLAIMYSAPPREGFEIAFNTASPGPVTIRVLAQRPGFPADAAAQVGARPPGLMTRPGMMAPWDELLQGDMTLVARSFTR